MQVAGFDVSMVRDAKVAIRLLRLLHGFLVRVELRAAAICESNRQGGKLLRPGGLRTPTSGTAQGLPSGMTKFTRVLSSSYNGDSDEAVRLFVGRGLAVLFRHCLQTFGARQCCGRS